MKRNYKAAAILVAMLLCAASFAGCGEEENTPTTDSAVSDVTGSVESGADNSDTDSSEASSSEDSESGESSDEDAKYDESLHDSSSNVTESSEAESVDESKNSENASKAQNPSEESKTTGNDDFDALFAENKLDADHKSDAQEVYTTEDMVQNEVKYKDLWLAEAANANSQLQASSLSDEEKQSIQQEYDEWVAGLDAKQQEILDEEMGSDGDGSIYRVNAAGKFMNYCRDYAMELYAKVYEAEGTFEPAYK